MPVANTFYPQVLEKPLLAVLLERNTGVKPITVARNGNLIQRLELDVRPRGLTGKGGQTLAFERYCLRYGRDQTGLSNIKSEFGSRTIDNFLNISRICVLNYYYDLITN